MVTNCDHLRRLKYSSSLPNAFTEHGAIMIASVLNTQRAIDASLFVVRAFVKLREILYTHKELAGKLEELERKIERHDDEIKAVFNAIYLMAQPEPKNRKIGF